MRHERVTCTRGEGHHGRWPEQSEVVKQLVDYSSKKSAPISIRSDCGKGNRRLHQLQGIWFLEGQNPLLYQNNLKSVKSFSM